MDSKKIGVVAGIVGVFGLAVQYAPAIILDRWIDRGFEGAIPLIGSPGQTVVVYNYIIEIVGPLATLVVAVGLGYYVARRVEIATEYRRVGGAIAIGSAVGVLVSGAPMLLGAKGAMSADPLTAFLLLAAVVRMLVEVALLVTIGAIAGAAIVTFRTDEERPGTSTDTGEFASTSPPRTIQEDSRPESQFVR